MRVTLAATLLAVATYPVRLAAAASRTILHLGHLFSSEGPVMRPGGYAERLAALHDLTAPDRPLGQALAHGGAVDRLVGPDGPVERLLAPGGALDQLMAPGGLADRLLSEDGYADQLFARGGTLDQLVRLGETLEDIRPRLTELADLIPSLHESVDALGRSVTPLSELANRFPGGRRRVTTTT